MKYEGTRHILQQTDIGMQVTEGKVCEIFLETITEKLREHFSKIILYREKKNKSWKQDIFSKISWIQDFFLPDITIQEIS